MELIASGAVVPVVDGTYDLADVERAFERLESGSQFGKIVVECRRAG
jgi:NADPH:quinone reductase-like Zn-dependent oxidoreductase